MKPLVKKYNTIQRGYRGYRGCHRIVCHVKTTFSPEPERDPEEYWGVEDAEEDAILRFREGESELEKELIRKYHYLDAGFIQYQRSVLENLFYAEDTELSGDELRELADGHRLQIFLKEHDVYLRIFAEQPNTFLEGFWDSMAELFTDWGITERLRDVLPKIIRDPSTFHTASTTEIPLKVQHYGKIEPK